MSNGIYLHPGFRGGSSIKHVLAVMHPELSFAGLKIDNDIQISIEWLRKFRGGMPASKSLINNMLSYGRLNTLAMVEIYRKFLALAKGN